MCDCAHVMDHRRVNDNIYQNISTLNIPFSLRIFSLDIADKLTEKELWLIYYLKNKLCKCIK